MDSQQGRSLCSAFFSDCSCNVLRFNIFEGLSLESSTISTKSCAPIHIWPRNVKTRQLQVATIYAYIQREWYNARKSVFAANLKYFAQYERAKADFFKTFSFFCYEFSFL